MQEISIGSSMSQGIAKIADAAWLKRLVPSAGAEEGGLK
jgi:hypothetical protein